MIRFMKYLIIVLVFFASLPYSTAAQTEQVPKNEFSVWGGYSPDSTHLIGTVPNARFGIVGIRYSRRFNNNRVINLKYNSDFIPASFLNSQEFPPLATPRRTSYAWGIAPLGLQANFRPRKKYQPFVEASGGFLYFNKRIPNDFGTHFNFTAYVGGGLEIKLNRNRGVSVGYKYFHVSNAYRGIVNPGYDNNVISVGYTFFSK
jgi:hypothetical protein